jgi:hypothetical protein
MEHLGYRMCVAQRGDWVDDHTGDGESRSRGTFKYTCKFSDVVPPDMTEPLHDAKQPLSIRSGILRQ